MSCFHVDARCSSIVCWIMHLWSVLPLLLFIRVGSVYVSKFVGSLFYSATLFFPQCHTYYWLLQLLILSSVNPLCSLIFWCYFGSSALLNFRMSWSVLTKWHHGFELELWWSVDLVGKNWLPDNTETPCGWTQVSLHLWSSSLLSFIRVVWFSSGRYYTSF